MKICYIDDDPDEVLLFRDAIRDIDPMIDCFGLTDSESAVEILASAETPDLIFLDYNMPRRSGEDCLLDIKAIDRLKPIPVIIYSTGVSEHQRRRLLGLGALMVVKKHNSLAAFRDFFCNTFLG